MGEKTLPVILLAGCDRRGTRLPETRPDLHLLRGYKAMELSIAGRPLLVRLLERLRAVGGFGPVLVAGPARVYASLADETGFQVVDTDGDFGQNLRAGVRALESRGHEGPAAVMTSDVLPDPDELRQALDDFERHRPEFWLVECRAADSRRLGASSWKRRYYIRPRGESEPVATLPGHMIVADPKMLRLDLLCRLVELAYRTRNQPTSSRRVVVVRNIVATLLFEDLKRLVTFRRPGLAYEMIWNGVVMVRKMVTSGIDQEEMEDRLRRIFLTFRHRRRHPGGRGRVMIHDGVSLARDIDTEEEARELGRMWEAVESSTAKAAP